MPDSFAAASGMLSGMPDWCPPWPCPERSVRHRSNPRKPLFSVILRSFFHEKERRGGCNRGLQCKRSKMFSVALARRGGQLPATGPRRGVRASRRWRYCLRRAKVANLSSWALVAELDEAELSRRLYPAVGVTPFRPAAWPLPDLDEGARGTRMRRPPNDARVAVGGIQRSAPERLPVLAVRGAVLAAA